MSTGRTLTAATVGLALVFTAAFGVGRLAPPVGSAPPAGPAPVTVPHAPDQHPDDTTTHSG